MGFEIKVILTFVFVGLAVASLFIDARYPGPQWLWIGNKRLLKTVTNGAHLKRWAKPLVVTILFLFFGACIILIWIGG